MGKIEFIHTTVKITEKQRKKLEELRKLAIQLGYGKEEKLTR